MRHASPKRPSFLAGITVAGGLLAAALCGCQTAPVATSPPSPATPGVTGRAEPTETVVDGIPVRVRDWPVGSRVAPGAVGREEIAARAIRYCQKLGVPLPPKLDAVTRREEGYGIPKQPFWTVQLLADDPVASRGGGVRVRFDAADQPAAFEDEKRQWEVIHRVGRTTPHRIQNEEDARKILWEFARRADVPPNAVLVESGEIDWERGWTLRGEWSGRGVVRGFFTLPTPGNYPTYPGQQPGLHVTVDPMDGALRSLGADWNFTYAPDDLRLTRAEAEGRARSLLGDATFANPTLPGGAANPYNATPRAELRYVRGFPVRRENGQLVADESAFRAQPGTRYRLAWVLIYGSHQEHHFAEVWVDATDGTCLGHVEHLHRGKPTVGNLKGVKSLPPSDSRP